MNIVMLGSTSKKEVEQRLRMVATAGVLSRSEGVVTDVYRNRKDNDKNLKLIKKVLSYGHRSITEHDYIVLAMENVTPIIEQTLIEYRLTSFTIKSRRNVDFRNVGFYQPKFTTKDGQILKDHQKLTKMYNDHMKYLFYEYGNLVDQGLPVEDCRYILPYSYYSNFIMGCDANELFRITTNLLYGHLSKIDELKEVGNRFKEIIDTYIPYLSDELEKEREKPYNEDQFTFLDNLVDYENKLLEKAKLITYQEDADDRVLCSILRNRYQLNDDKAKKVLDDLVKNDPNIKQKMIDGLIHSKNQRELEQVNYTFELPISLAVLTHMTRHRTQSLLVPEFIPLWNMDNYIIPDTIKETNEEKYKEIYNTNKKVLMELINNGVKDEDLIYFYLSGNACNITTTMDARTLEWITRMRTCQKAQWEIRYLIEEMMRQVQEVNPIIGKSLGPTCKIEGYCPEGNDSCKNRGVVVKQKVINNN